MKEGEGAAREGRALAAHGVEGGGVHGAEAGVGDAGNAAVAELDGNGAGKVNMGPRPIRATDNGFGGEAGGDFFADFEAFGADVGADGGDNARRVGAERGHGVQGVGSDAGDSAAPAAVNGGDDSGVDVGQQEGEAVGSVDSDGNMAPAGNNAINAAEVVDSGNGYAGGMGLNGETDAVATEAGEALEAPQVGFGVGGGGAGIGADVETGVSAECAHAGNVGHQWGYQHRITGQGSF